MNYLCVCRGGCVRSVALAYLIKYSKSATDDNHEGTGDNAIAVGVDHLENDSKLAQLCLWSDVILTVSDSVHDKFVSLLHEYDSQQFISRIKHVPIGPDVWGLKEGPYNDKLLKLASKLLDELNAAVSDEVHD